MINITLSTNRL